MNLKYPTHQSINKNQAVMDKIDMKRSQRIQRIIYRLQRAKTIQIQIR